MPDDPERLADAASRSQLSELFASASRDLPSDEQLARLAANLGPVFEAPPGAPPAVPGVSILVKLGVVTGAVALLVGTGLAVRSSSHTAPISPTVTRQVTVTAPAPAADAMPTPPASSSSPAPDPAASAAEVSTPPALDKPGAASSKPPSAQSKAPSEAALLEQARRALNSSPASALQLANQHRARFPNGVLSQEREVIAIEALRRLHRTAEADQRGAGFSKAFPGSAHQRMVDETPK